MALHLRDQIMDALATLLTGLTTTGARVYVDQDADSEPLADGQLPGLTIMQRDESSEMVSLPQPRIFQRLLDIEIVAHVKLTTPTAARKQLNLIDKEVQTAIAGSLSLGGACKHLTPQQVDFEFDGGGDKPMARARMRYQALYLFAENAPDVAM